MTEMVRLGTTNNEGSQTSFLNSTFKFNLQSGLPCSWSVWFLRMSYPIRWTMGMARDTTGLQKVAQEPCAMEACLLRGQKGWKDLE